MGMNPPTVLAIHISGRGSEMVFLFVIWLALAVYVFLQIMYNVIEACTTKYGASGRRVHLQWVAVWVVAMAFLIQLFYWVWNA